ncbi:hypothetical protein ACFSBZ_01180 [Amnibacterium flavum]|nr:hypothetical protein [Amnibacterium flavum]
MADEVGLSEQLAEIAGLPLVERAVAYADLLEKLRTDLEADGRA